MNRRLSISRLLAIVAVGSCTLLATTTQATENAAEAAKRIGGDIEYLASDALEGRGPGTKGLQVAAEYIRDNFKEAGLKGGAEDGSYMQPFQFALGTEPVMKKTWLILRGPDGQEIKLEAGTDYQPLATGGDGTATAEVVFIGYGISAADKNYDDYDGIDVDGKVVLMIRREPQQDDDSSVFDGKNITSHSYIRTKLEVAKENEAAAILMVNDPASTAKAEKDVLSKPNAFGSSSLEMPIAHLKQEVANKLLTGGAVETSDGKQLTTVAAIEESIDQTLEPISQPIDGWTAELAFTFETIQADVGNVVGVLEGEGPLADETVVIGAHYDHLGYGPYGSRRPNANEVHNGADDNATGTAAVMELARRFGNREKKPARRMVFIGFTGEERGLLGSNYYIKNPLIPLEKTVAMINFDMIGNLREEGGLQLGGVPTGKEFAALVERLVDGGTLKVNTSVPLAGSDHTGFYRSQIPVVFFHTGLTGLYHTPDDDFETINVAGVVKTIDFAESFVDGVVNLPQRPEFVEMQRRSARRRGGAVAYLGVVPDYSTSENGLRLSEISEGGPAAKGGLQAGDIITKIGDVAVADIQGLTSGLRKYKPDQEIEIVVQRGDETVTLKVTLGRTPSSR